MDAAANPGAWRPDRFWRYQEMTGLLQDLARAYPDLCRLEGIGTSPEGRTIWSVTLTRFSTGPDLDKPAYHINANHHAGEVTGSTVALYTIKYLLEQYGRDPEATRLLDTRALYVLPRLTVDGSEFYFDQPQMLRSSALPYPAPEEQPGLHPEDVDGDGRILLMRFPDPLGEWQASARDPRLLVRRRPEDRGGPFYRLLAEGVFKELTPAGVAPAAGRPRSLAPAPPARGLDFNRNYPLNWQPQHRQPGAGRYPLDRPEVSALVDFFLAHPNICGAMSYHTFSGMLLRPGVLVPDEQLDRADLAAYRYLGELCREVTGYPCVSVYQDFTSDYDPRRLDVGSWLEWAYDQQGTLAFEMELWDWPYIAGVPKKPFKEQRQWTDAEREDHGLLMLAWNDRELGGRGFIPWHPVAHPQLGAVEIGGWEPKWVLQNTPAHLLPGESHRNCRFTIRHALASPLLRVGEVEVQPVGAGLYKVAARVENHGWLPTHVTAVARQLQVTRGVTVSLTGAAVRGGKAKVDLGELQGAGSAAPPAYYGAGPAAQSVAWAEWVVQGAPGTAVTVQAAHPRAGKDRREVVLP